ncbi:unnamed protein product (mitochondrion) [Plasmodiophora brassicae]|uniref:Nucleolar protein 12 n=1 Tax=Plasmodiophora brassicae TaxID=37360 RepID=A0A3P3YBZ1_PLABS|nr:unnamed protein product [Plasmodiophora brassicae]
MKAKPTKRGLRKPPRRGPKLISFDEDSRVDFVTGFHKRKVQRQEHARKELEEKARKERRERRKDQRKARTEYYETLHPSLFKDHKLVDVSSDEECQNDSTPAVVHQFDDDEFESVVVTTTSGTNRDKAFSRITGKVCRERC